MIDKPFSAHVPDEQIIEQYQRTRQHVELPDDLPEDLRQELDADPNQQSLTWVIDESQGDLSLLRLLLLRDKISQRMLDPLVDRSLLAADMQPIIQAIKNRKQELGIYNDSQT